VKVRVVPALIPDKENSAFFIGSALMTRLKTTPTGIQAGPFHTKAAARRRSRPAIPGVGAAGGESRMSEPFDVITEPQVFVKDGEVFASSRDVAAFFGKEDRNVLRDIDALIAEEPDLRLLNFQEWTMVTKGHVRPIPTSSCRPSYSRPSSFNPHSRSLDRIEASRPMLTRSWVGFTVTSNPFWRRGGIVVAAGALRVLVERALLRRHRGGRQGHGGDAESAGSGACENGLADLVDPLVACRRAAAPAGHHNDRAKLDHARRGSIGTAGRHGPTPGPQASIHCVGAWRIGIR